MLVKWCCKNTPQVIIIAVDSKLTKLFLKKSEASVPRIKPIILISKQLYPLQGKHAQETLRSMATVAKED